MSEIRTIFIKEQEGRLDTVLSILCPDLSRTRLQSLIKGGDVRQEGNTGGLSPSHKVKKNEVYHLSIPELEDPEPQAQDIGLDVVYEDDYLIVINKAPGMVVHPAPGHREGTLVNALLSHCGESLSGIGGVKRPGIVHRLDKGTSGLMVVAKTDHAHHYLSRQFTDRSLGRVYWALCWNPFTCPYGEISGNIGRHPRDRKKMALLKTGGREAHTSYTVLESFSMGVSLVECRLKTGRTHQIRVHLSSQNHGLVGDPLYSKTPGSSPLVPYLKNVWPLERPALHARELYFNHPATQEPMTFVTDLPEDFEKLLSYLRNI